MRKQGRNQTIKRKIAGKPGVGSLLLSILEGMFTDGMQLPVILGSALIAGLYYVEFPYHSEVAGLAVVALFITGLIRGCSRWQQNLAGYYEDLAVPEEVQQSNRGRDACDDFPVYFR